jgi:hypothetical protein
MDFNTMIFVTLLASAITDALIFVCLIFVLGVLFFLLYKIFKNKVVVAENNRELHEHDKEIFALQEKLEEIENG